MSERDKYLNIKLGWTFPYPDEVPEYMFHPETEKHSMSCYQTFSTWSGIGKLWEWAEKQDWWEQFVYDTFPVDHSIVNPDRFADAVYAYLKECDK
jgi:hypothetical protein